MNNTGLRPLPVTLCQQQHGTRCPLDFYTVPCATYTAIPPPPPRPRAPRQNNNRGTEGLNHRLRSY